MQLLMARPDALGAFTVGTLKLSLLSQHVFKKDDDGKRFTSVLVHRIDCYCVQTQLWINGLIRKSF